MYKPTYCTKIYKIKQEHMSMWDTVKRSPSDLKGKKPFAPYSGFTLGTLYFTH